MVLGELPLVHMHGMEILAKSGEAAGIFLHPVGVVAYRTGEGYLSRNTLEANPYALAVGHKVAGGGNRQASLIHFVRELEFIDYNVERCSLVVEFEHDVRVAAMEQALSVRALARMYILADIYPQRFHII